MTIKLCQSKGTLIRMFITFDNETGLNINPLFYDAAVIAFGSEANKYLSNSNVPDGHVQVFNHKSEVVADFAVDGKIIEISNTVLYPNGNVWSGPILEELDKNDVAYMVLTEEASHQLKNSDGLTFDADEPGLKPTIVVGLKSRLIPTCSEFAFDHKCTACWFKGKVIVNGLCHSPT